MPTSFEEMNVDGYDLSPITGRAQLYKESIQKGYTDGWLLLKEAIPLYFGFADEWRPKMNLLGHDAAQFAPEGCKIDESELHALAVSAVHDQSLPLLNHKTKSENAWRVSPNAFLLFLQSEDLPMHPEFVKVIVPDGVLPDSVRDASNNQLKNNIARIQIKRHPTVHLEALAAVIAEFWLPFNPKKPSEHAVAKTIVSWIQKKYPEISSSNAEAIAALSRHPKAKLGRTKVVKKG